MSESLKFAASLAVFAAFALLNPLYFLGCGRPCTGDDFEYSAEQLERDMAPLIDGEHNYFASNESGRLILTVQLDEGGIEEGSPTWASAGEAPSVVKPAMACSEINERVFLVSGTFSATFEFDDGEREQLFVDEEFQAVHRVHGIENEPTRSKLTYNSPYEVTFELQSFTGVGGFEISRFDAEDFGAANFQRY